MTDVSTDVGKHKNAHNHTNVQETETLHRPTINCVKFFFNIDFQRSKSGFTLDEKSKLPICFILNIFQEQLWLEWY